jgi:quercetin dioxygenase-like cupin family protein
MEIKRPGSQPSAKGSSEWFTGTVRVDPLFQAPDPAHVSGASVTFEPGARTAWHIAYTSARTDVNRNGRMRLGSAGRWSSGGDPGR